MRARRAAKKDGHTLQENCGTQPIVQHRVFNNPEVLTEGWYPVCPSKEVGLRQAQSFVVFKQRLAIFRGESGEAHALDAFCPHMGADLGNGEVIGDELRCYFHRWRFDGGGKLTVVPNSDERPKNACLASYPTEEKYGWIWVFSAKGDAPYPVPSPPGLEGQPLDALHIGAPKLFAHHHVMMANGIDLQHFSAVHNLDVDFEYTVEESQPNVFEWNLEGELGREGLKYKFLRKLLGPTVGYIARFAGGSVVTLAYGPNQRFGGDGFKIPPLYILWGCLPDTDGISRVHVWIVSKRRKGPFGWLLSRLLLALSVVLLVALRDADVKAFPNMRFNPKNLVQLDRSVARLIQLIDKLPISSWSGSESP